MKLLPLLLFLAATACSSKKDESKPPATAAAAADRVELTVTEAGFQPDRVTLAKGKPVTLVVTRKTDKTCATDIVVPDLGIEKALPLDQPVEVALIPEKEGELKFGCAMGQMVSGVFVIE